MEPFHFISVSHPNDRRRHARTIRSLVTRKQHASRPQNRVGKRTNARKQTPQVYKTHTPSHLLTPPIEADQYDTTGHHVRKLELTPEVNVLQQIDHNRRCYGISGHTEVLAHQARLPHADFTKPRYDLSEDEAYDYASDLVHHYRLLRKLGTELQTANSVINALRKSDLFSNKVIATVAHLARHAVQAGGEFQPDIHTQFLSRVINEHLGHEWKMENRELYEYILESDRSASRQYFPENCALEVCGDAISVF